MKIDEVKEVEAVKEETAPKKRRRKQEVVVEEAKPKKEMTLEKKIEAWKKEFGDRVYRTSLFGETYIWKAITRSEYKEIRQTPGDDREIIICLQQTLFPENKETLQEIFEEKAGIPTTLSEEILEKSGFVNFPVSYKL